MTYKRYETLDAEITILHHEDTSQFDWEVLDYEVRMNTYDGSFHYVNEGETVEDIINIIRNERQQLEILEKVLQRHVSTK